jgi:cytochrome subunit of sulfide dehydrogenase
MHRNHHLALETHMTFIARCAGIAATLALAAGLASAQTTGSTGRLLASNCFQCHGTNGKGPGFDTIAGKSANEVYEKMKAFQSGHEGQSIMAKHSFGYTDAQLRDLSNYLSRQR